MLKNSNYFHLLSVCVQNSSERRISSIQIKLSKTEAMFFILLTTILLAILVIQLLFIALDSYKAHQFFKINKSTLPILPNPSLFGGHINKTLVCKQNWRILVDLHEKYGKTYGYFYHNQPVVSTIDLNLLKTINIDEPDDHLGRLFGGTPADEIEVDCIVSAQPKQWRRLRRTIAPAFSNLKVKQPDNMMKIQKIVDKYMDSIEKRLDNEEEKGGQSFIVADVANLSHRFMLAIVFSCFYKQDNFVDFYSTHEQTVEMIEKSLGEIINPFLRFTVISSFIRNLARWYAYNIHPFGKMRDTIFKFFDKQGIKEKYKEKFLRDKNNNSNSNNSEEDFSNSSNSLVNYITDKLFEGKLTLREYYHSTYFLFFAADKTTTDAIAMLIYHLATHPEIQEKLRESIFKDGHDSEYLGWCLNESTRLYPPVLTGGSHTISRDIETEAGLVPAGTFVIPTTWLINRSKDAWGPDVNEFKPERWANSKNFHPCQYLSFAVGKRNCLGKHFALLVIKILMNNLLSKYKFERSSKTNDLINFESPLLAVNLFHKPIYIKISRLIS